MGLRVFLSYGRDEYAAATERIKELLTARGHAVWFDRERLTGGMDWEHSIEHGIEWVAEDPSRGRVVMMMTPHSVRRPDGYCLNELARALQRNLLVVPVMLVSVEPPLSITRLQWVDMTACLPLPERQHAFDSQADVLMSALESGQVPLSDERERLSTVLRPIAFDYEMSSGLAGFVNREWAIDGVDGWLADPSSSSVFWLTGGVGTGKTTIALWLAANRREFAAWHFCKHGHLIKADARRCLTSLAYQLSTQLPDYAEQLRELDLADLVQGASNAKTLFDSLVLQPLTTLPAPDRTIVAIIDGLDEATINQRNDLADLVASVRGGPRWLRLLVTSRDEPPITAALQGALRLDLDQHAAETSDDLTQFVRDGLQARPGADSAEPGVVARIIERAHGSFLYAEAVVADIAAGRLALGDPDALPSGLGGVFWRLFERQFPDPTAYRERVRPLLELLAAALEPLPLPLVAEVLAWGTYDRQAVLSSTGSICVTVANAIQPFHASIVEWMTDESAAGNFWVSAEEGQARLAAAGLTRIDDHTSAAERYFDVHLTDHLIAANRFDDAAKRLVDHRYAGSSAYVETSSRRSPRRDEVIRLAQTWPPSLGLEPLRACAENIGNLDWVWIPGWCECARELTPASFPEARDELDIPFHAEIGDAILRLRSALGGTELVPGSTSAQSVLRGTDRVAIFAGCAEEPTSSRALEALESKLSRALVGCDGVILADAAATGLPGIVSRIARMLDLRLVGYTPSGRADRSLHPTLRETRGGTTPVIDNQVAMWTDILAAGIPVENVSVIVCAGGPRAVAAALLARSLGAKVLWLDPTIDTMVLLGDELPPYGHGVPEGRIDAMTVRAFLPWPRPPDDFGEKAARCFHDEYRRWMDSIRVPPWEDLPPARTADIRAMADHIPSKLAALGRRLSQPGERLQPTDAEIELLAEAEHGRFNLGKLNWELDRATVDPSRFILAWDELKLTDEMKEFDRELVRDITAVLGATGWGVADL